MNYLYYLSLILGFFAVVLFLEGIYLAWNASMGPEAKRIEQRLHAMAAGGSSAEISIVKKRLLADSPFLDKFLLGIPRIHQFDRLLVQAGVGMTVMRFMAITLFLGAAGFAVGTYFALPFLLVAGLTLGCAFLPLLHVQKKRQKRIQMIEQQLPDALDFLGRAMRAGHAFVGALKMVGDEMPQPVGGEFRITFDEINYGIPLAEALTNLAIRVPSTDLRYFVIAVLIQRETGGNLSELLDNISALIRARLKLLGSIRVLSAEGRLSAWILSLLPFVLTAVINVVNPNFMSVLWSDPAGLKLIWAALFLMALGIFWMRRIIRIRV